MNEVPLLPHIAKAILLPASDFQAKRRNTFIPSKVRLIIDEDSLKFDAKNDSRGIYFDLLDSNPDLLKQIHHEISHLRRASPIISYPIDIRAHIEIHPDPEADTVIEIYHFDLAGIQAVGRGPLTNQQLLQALARLSLIEEILSSSPAGPVEPRRPFFALRKSESFDDPVVSRTFFASSRREACLKLIANAAGVAPLNDIKSGQMGQAKAVLDRYMVAEPFPFPENYVSQTYYKPSERDTLSGL